MDDLKAPVGTRVPRSGRSSRSSPSETACKCTSNTPSRSLELKPVDRDIVQKFRMTVRFPRDKYGKVVSLGYRSSLVRNVKFSRLIYR